MTDWLANLSVKWVLVAVATCLVLRMTLPRVSTVPRAWADSMTEFLESALVALVLVFLVLRPFVVQAFFIPSESMLPTLQPGDRMLVNKLIYRVRSPRQGEIVVFRAPMRASGGERTDFVKRLIGRPGDLVEVVPDTVLVDGKPAVQFIARDQMVTTGTAPVEPKGIPIGRDAPIRVEGRLVLEDSEVRVVVSPDPHVTYHGGDVFVDGQVRLKLNMSRPYDSTTDLTAVGGSAELEGTVIYGPMGDVARLVVVRGHEVSLRPGHVRVNGHALREPYLKEPPRYVLPPTLIPAGKYFMMGDNRNNSNDSHSWGPLEADRVLGKATFTFWPPSRIGLVH